MNEKSAFRRLAVVCGARRRQKRGTRVSRQFDRKSTVTGVTSSNPFWTKTEQGGAPQVAVLSSEPYVNRGDSVPNRSRLIAVVALVLLSWTGSPAQPAAPARAPLVSPRPLADVSVQFQEWRGKIVTYEEPLLTWSGDLREITGKSGTKGYLYPKEQAFLMPPEAESEPDLGVALNKTLEAYHQQTTGTRFQILTSKWGYHIVPLQVHDDHGALVPARSLLDAPDLYPQRGAHPVGASSGVRRRRPRGHRHQP